MLELLDGKIAVERGSLSMTMAQDDNHRKELETCRNDLTNCLEASSQMQRWANNSNPYYIEFQLKSFLNLSGLNFQLQHISLPLIVKISCGVLFFGSMDNV